MPRKRKRVRPAGARKRGRFMQPSVEVTHVQCECGGRYLRPGTARGAASYRAHIATQRHWRAENAALAQRVETFRPLMDSYDRRSRCGGEEDRYAASRRSRCGGEEDRSASDRRSRRGREEDRSASDRRSRRGGEEDHSTSDRRSRRGREEDRYAAASRSAARRDDRRAPSAIDASLLRCLRRFPPGPGLEDER